MKYARMAEGRLSKVTLPPLNGGLNVYDIPSRVADNQLTACDNMWWYRGALRTRPGLKLAGEEWREDIYYTARQKVGEQELLMVHLDKKTDGTDFSAVYLSGTKGRSTLQSTPYRLQMDAEDLTAFGIRGKKNSGAQWYYLFSTGEIIQNVDNGWEPVEPYIPIVMINGVGEECEAVAEPSVYEDYNRLTRGFTCHFTTDGTSTTFKLPEVNLATNLPGLERENEEGGVLAEVEIDLPSGNTKTAKITAIADSSQTVGVIETDCEEMGFSTVGGNSPVEIWVSLNRKKGALKVQPYYILTVDGNRKKQPVEGGLPFVTSNNLRVTAWRGREHEKDRIKICKMTRGEWFGGTRSGIGGGTRLFVCGNPDEPDLLCWTGIEHPLYFPESNYLYVGDTASAITTMSKQSDLLVLFKERETYAIQYSTDTNYDFAQEGGVAITAYMATFYLMPINASVGCDCPDTVRLVNNRLVWATSSGQVYMLTATNQFSERNVRMISRNIREVLYDGDPARLKEAQCGEFEGYYLLLMENKLFLMNTQNGAFQSFNYYDDENKAGKAIPWYVWTLPEKFTYTGMASDEGTISLIVIDEKAGVGKLGTLKGDTDDGEPIHCHFATKLWDFGTTDHKKSVEQLYIGLRCDDMPHVSVTYLTDKGRRTDPYRLQNTGIDAEGYCPIRRLTPNMRMVQAFGLEIDSRSALETDSLLLKIRSQGVVR